MLETILVLWAALGSLVMAVAVASDARSRGVSPWVWFVVTLLLNVFGALAYLVVRPPYRLEDEVVESEPAEVPATLPTVPTGPSPTRWTRAAGAPARGEPLLDDDGDEDAEYPSPEHAPPAQPPNRTWLYVGGAVFLGLVVVAALFAYVTAPPDGAASLAHPTVASTAVAPATPTPPPALLAPTQPPAPAASPTPQAVPTQSTEYVVQAGDTLSGIAGRYGVTVQDIQDANGLTGETIQPGQHLKIPART